VTFGVAKTNGPNESAAIDPVTTTLTADGGALNRNGKGVLISTDGTDVPFLSNADHTINAVPSRPKGLGVRIADTSGGGNNTAEDIRVQYASQMWVKGLSL
jgi:hypothetical protein